MSGPCGCQRHSSAGLLGREVIARLRVACRHHRLADPVEGGGTLNFELLQLGLVDEVKIYVAPMVFGGESAPTAAAGQGLERSEAIHLRLEKVEGWEDGGVVLEYSIERSK